MRPNTADMHPVLLERYLAFKAAMIAANVPFMLTCVLRTRAEQEAYYAQGREELAAVNAKRKLAGMGLIGPKENAYRVTQTKNSRHFPGPDGKSRAFDIAILRGDKAPTWDLKWDGDKDSIPDYKEAALIGQSVGLDPGAFWKSFKDWPHYQLPKGVL